MMWVMLAASSRSVTVRRRYETHNSFLLCNHLADLFARFERVEIFLVVLHLRSRYPNYTE